VRKHMHLLVSLLVLMIPANMPELRNRKDTHHLVEVLLPNMSDEDAAKSFEAEIYSCMNDKFKRFDNTFHIIAHKLS